MAVLKNTPARATQIITPKAAIAAAFGVHTRTVERWADEGAPITVDGGRYMTEAYDLWTWLLAQGKHAKKGPY